ncbi:MAG: hypothetical protein ABFD76_15400 [Smithella sp.]
MKKYFSKLITALILIASLTALAADIQFYPFPFVGKWNPTEDAMLLDDYGLQDISNLRKEGKHFKGVSGHTKINSTVPDASNNYLINGFHFRKDNPQESHVLMVMSNDLTPTTASNIIQNTTAIPSAGNFTTTAVLTPTTVSQFRFSVAPGGSVVMSSDYEQYIWGGNELNITAFFTSSANVTASELTNARDYSEQVTNSSEDSATITTGINSYMKLVLLGDGTDASTTITDSSSGGKTVTAKGDAQLDTAHKKFGTASILFDGSGDYLETADHADWYLGSGNFTISTWLKIRRYASAGTRGICGQYQDANNYWFLGYDTDSYYSDKILLKFLVVVGGETKASYMMSSKKDVGDDWHHIQLVRKATAIYMFIDGDSKALTVSTAISTNEVPDLTPKFLIGSGGLPSGTAGTIDGWMDDFVVENGIARHTTDFSVPTSSFSADNYFVIGTTRPIQGVKFYLNGSNAATSTLAIATWAGNAWESLPATDNTSSGGVSLAQTGTVTWDTTVNTSKTRYINGYSLYWYRFYLNAGSAEIYYVTADAPVQKICNVWDGVEVKAASVKLYADSANYADFTAELGDDDDNTYMNVEDLSNSAKAVYLGFTEPQQGIDFRMQHEKEETADFAMTVQYWDGATWVAVSSLNDATYDNGGSLNRNGVASFPPIGDEEQTRTIADELPCYVYRVSFSGDLGVAYVSEVRGIPAPKPITNSYKLSQMFSGRLFLLNESGGRKNKALYSVYNSSDIWNGEDSGELYFGDDTDITAAVSIYNVFNSTGGIEQLIVAKKNETYRLTGSDAKTWSIQRISNNIGCVAPLSMVSADITEIDNAKRQVAIWVSDKGVYMSDGATVRRISDEIGTYFNPSSSKYIPASMQPKSFGWYDPSIQSYKLLIASGSSATYLNAELEYSLKYNEWTKIDRMASTTANPLQCGFNVYDTSGVGYTYGGGKDGYMYRLENGNNWDGTNIISSLWTKDIIMDTAAPLARLSTVKHLRVAHKKKSTGEITITHYGDGSVTTSGSGGQMGTANITAANALAHNFDTQSVLLGPNLTHSFKFSAASNTADGLELTGMGVWYEPYNLIRQ